MFSLGGRGQSFLPILVSHGLAIFISILAHELGHAMVGKMFGSHHVHIVLHGFGGLAIGARGRSRFEEIQISAAGPGMGFLLAVPFAVTFAKTPFGQMWIADRLPFLSDYVTRFVSATGGPTNITNIYLMMFIYSMLWVNIMWGLVNLLPVYPLDGGQICAEIVGGDQVFGPQPLAHKISIGVAVAAAVFFLGRGHTYAAILFGYLGFVNFQMLQRRRY
jgi:membrane-associated protease RseP (regulator of RpoE activity)